MTLFLNCNGITVTKCLYFKQQLPNNFLYTLTSLFSSSFRHDSHSLIVSSRDWSSLYKIVFSLCLQWTFFFSVIFFFSFFGFHFCFFLVGLPKSFWKSKPVLSGIVRPVNPSLFLTTLVHTLFMSSLLDRNMVSPYLQVTFRYYSTVLKPSTKKPSTFFLSH